jgi:hypothetical protein
MADHFDTYLKKIEPSERTLCGHVDLSPRGMGSWQQPYLKDMPSGPWTVFEVPRPPR